MSLPTNTSWSVGDAVTAARLNQFSTDISFIFKEISGENLSFTYDSNGQLTQVVDSENSITINIDWTEWDAATPRLYIQRAGDTKKWTITYNAASGVPTSIVYA